MSPRHQSIIFISVALLELGVYVVGRRAAMTMKESEVNAPSTNLQSDWETKSSGFGSWYDA